MNSMRDNRVLHRADAGGPHLNHSRRFIDFSLRDQLGILVGTRPRDTHGTYPPTHLARTSG